MPENTVEHPSGADEDLVIYEFDRPRSVGFDAVVLLCSMCDIRGDVPELEGLAA